MKIDERYSPAALIEGEPASSLRSLLNRRAGRPLELGSNAPIFRPSAGRVGSDSFAFNALPDSVLLGWLSVQGPRPNVLVECSAEACETAMRHLMTWCSLPFRYCTIPGALELPNPARGTLLLKDVSGLTIAQQVTLYDWLTGVQSQVQVISLTTTCLEDLVEDGLFLEGLLYRLNVIRLCGLTGTRPAPLDAWQMTSEQLS